MAPQAVRKEALGLAAFLLAAGSILGPGCTSPGRAAPSEATTPRESHRKAERIRDLLPGATLASGRLEVVRVDTLDKDGAHGAMVEVVNRSQRPVAIRYRVLWYAKDHREVQRGPPSWTDLRVGPDAIGSLSSWAPARWCERFEIEVEDLG